jgi:release factor glutamine methyltransferase
MTRADFAAGMTITAARRRLADLLRQESFDTPDLDARVLVAHALGLDHAGLIRDGARTLASVEIDAVASVAARRLKREPVARIVGMKEFWSLPLTVNAATLVPRPETETVVEAALAAVDAGGGRNRPLHVLDIGTGSGALLLALLAELPNAFGIGTDISIAAVQVARSNAARNGLSARTRFVACDVAEALSGPFDLVVSNPPYVAQDTIAQLAPGVRDYEPRIALDGGTDGLDAYRAIAAQVPRVLAPHGHLSLEIGAGQSAAVAAILAAHGLAVTAIARDISGTLRALTAVRA